MDAVSIITTIAGLLIGFLISYYLGSKVAASKLKEIEARAKSIIDDAEKTANTTKKEKLLEVKEEWSKKKIEFETEVQTRKSKLHQLEKQLKQKEDIVNQKGDGFAKKEKVLIEFESELKKKELKTRERENELEKVIKTQKNKLEKLSGLSKEEAKKQLLESLTNEAKIEAAKTINQICEDARLKANKEAQNIILNAIQRLSTEHCIENTVSVVNLDNDEMKGRIIGREGRNIRAFEAATGVDLIIDDTPEAVVISGYDPFRREVARKALEKLMLDGRIHPTRIEELVEKTRKELDEEMLKEGENITLELGVHNIHPELVKYIGRMKFRTSYGQNLLSHSIEVAYLAGIMAAELRLDQKLAKRSALLHDIGKCVDKELEGTHATLGADLAKKYKENHIVCNAIGAHHGDIEPESPYAVIVQAADSISGSRPGARRESIENYVKRLEKLEEISNSFDGVGKTFAIQAGREIRVIVEPEKLDDIQTDILASDIAKKIEAEMEYPGQIKVTVIRERRSVSVAK